MNQLYLIGYMGSGKSTIGSQLAKELNWRFLDLDTLIESRSAHSIPDLFKLYGEGEFRLLERRVLQSVQHLSEVVIATGGGAPCYSDNLSFMKIGGLVVYLKGDPHTLYQRIISDTTNVRPIIKDKPKEELLEFVTRHIDQRKSFYDQAHFTIDVEQAPKEIVKSIIVKM